MTRELCEQLYKAGFPNRGRADGMLYDFSPDDKTTVLFSPPILEELIEACGDEFDTLGKFNNGWAAETNFSRTEGKTPSEAVANLWLVLNRKQDV